MESELRDAEDALRDINAVFHNTPDPYAQLFYQRQDLERIVSPPCKRLPPELLSKIFLFFMPISLPPKPDDPHIVLPRVCRAWKDLLLQSPQFWASISVVFDQESVDVQRMASIAVQLFSFTGTTCPLSISAACAGVYAKTVHDEPDRVSGFIATVVLPHVHRLQHVDLTFPFEALHPLFLLPSGSFPCLETLALRPLLSLSDTAIPEEGYSHWHWPADTKAFESATLVREIVYLPEPLFKIDELEALMPDVMEQAMNDPTQGSLGHYTFAPTFPLPWAQLKVINFYQTAHTPDVWHAIVTQCPGVEELWVAIKPSLDDQHPVVALSLPHLATLCISAFCGGAEDMLDRLLVPNLRTFSCIGAKVELSKILSFQSRSNFELECLGLVLPIEAGDVEPLMAAFPTLKVIFFLFTPTEHFPESFWERIGQGELLPALEVFIIRPTPAQISKLVDIIDAKWQNVEFHMAFCYIRPAHLEAVKEELKRLDKYDPAEVERRVLLDLF